MEILGIGPMELLLILVIALIVMGPNDMVKTGRTIGKFLRQLVKSPTWQAVQQTSHDLRYLPNRLMREAGMEEEIDQLKEIGKNVSAMGDIRASLNEEIGKVGQEIQQTGKDLSAWTTSPTSTEEADSPAPPAQKPVVEPVIKPPEPGATAPGSPHTASSDTPPDHDA
jgi:sec-independent protein translocase protein TatB